MSKTLAIVLIIVFNLIFLSGCKTFNFGEGKWTLPNKPNKKQVESIFVQKNETFVPVSDGIYMDGVSAKNLLTNIRELDAYIEKQETLIKSMKKYYNDK